MVEKSFNIQKVILFFVMFTFINLNFSFDYSMLCKDNEKICNLKNLVSPILYKYIEQLPDNQLLNDAINMAFNDNVNALNSCLIWIDKHPKYKSSWVVIFATVWSILEGWPFDKSTTIFANVLKNQKIRTLEGLKRVIVRKFLEKVGEVSLLGKYDKYFKKKENVEYHYSFVSKKLAAVQWLNLLLFGIDWTKRLEEAVIYFLRYGEQWHYYLGSLRMINLSETDRVFLMIKENEKLLKDKDIKKYFTDVAISWLVDAADFRNFKKYEKVALENDWLKIADIFADFVNARLPNLKKFQFTPMEKRVKDLLIALEVEAYYYAGLNNLIKKLEKQVMKIKNERLKVEVLWRYFLLFKNRRKYYGNIILALEKKTKDEVHTIEIKQYLHELTLSDFSFNYYDSMKNLLKRYPPAERLYREATIYDEMQKFLKAIDSYEKLIKKYPNFDRVDFARYRIAQIWLIYFNYKLLAKKYLEEEIKKGKDPYYIFMAYKLLFEIANDKDKKEILRQAIIKLPQHRAEIFYLKARWEEEKNKKQEAFIDYINSLRANFYNRYQKIIIDKIAKFVSGDWLAKLYKEDPDGAWEEIKASGKWEKIIPYLEKDKTLTAEVRLMQAYYNVGDYLNVSKNISQILKQIQKEKQFKEYEVTLLKWQIESLAKLGNFKDARKILNANKEKLGGDNYIKLEDELDKLEYAQVDLSNEEIESTREIEAVVKDEKYENIRKELIKGEKYKYEDMLKKQDEKSAVAYLLAVDMIYNQGDENYKQLAKTSRIIKTSLILNKGIKLYSDKGWKKYFMLEKLRFSFLLDKLNINNFAEKLLEYEKDSKYITKKGTDELKLEPDKVLLYIASVATKYQWQDCLKKMYRDIELSSSYETREVEVAFVISRNLLMKKEADFWFDKLLDLDIEFLLNVFDKYKDILTFEEKLRLARKIVSIKPEIKVIRFLQKNEKFEKLQYYKNLLSKFKDKDRESLLALIKILQLKKDIFNLEKLYNRTKSAKKREKIAFSIASKYQELGQDFQKVIYWYRNSYLVKEKDINQLFWIANNLKDKMPKVSYELFKIVARTNSVLARKAAILAYDCAKKIGKDLALFELDWLVLRFRDKSMRKFVKREKKWWAKQSKKKVQVALKFKVREYKNWNEALQRINKLKSQLYQLEGEAKYRAMFEIAIIYQQFKKWEEAMKYLDQLYTIGDKFSLFEEVLYRRSEVAEEMKDWEVAVECLKYMVDSWPDRPDTEVLYYRLIKDMLAAGQIYDVQMWIDRFKNLFSDSDYLDDVYYYEAVAYEKLGNYDEAKQLYLDFVNRWPQSQLADNAYYRLGQLYQYIFGDKTQAKVYYEKVINGYLDSDVREDAEKEAENL